MSKIKIAELFYSIQGEGRYMGVPSVFLRTFGCNFKCAGFGMPKGIISGEADVLAEKQEKYKKVKKSSRRMRPLNEWIEIPTPKIIGEDLFEKN